MVKFESVPGFCHKKLRIFWEMFKVKFLRWPKPFGLCACHSGALGEPNKQLSSANCNYLAMVCTKSEFGSELI